MNDNNYSNDELLPNVKQLVESLDSCMHLLQIRDENDEWIRFVDLLEGSIIGINKNTEEIALKVGGEEYHDLNSKVVEKLVLLHKSKSAPLEQTNLEQNHSKKFLL
jgi:hypothetical protein